MPVIGRLATGMLVLAFVSLSSVCAQAGKVQVQPGDSLWALAKRHGVSVEAIKAANRLSGDSIRSGQTLNIPKGNPVRVEAKPADAKHAAREENTPAKGPAKAKATESKAPGAPAKAEPSKSEPSKVAAAKAEPSKVAAVKAEPSKVAAVKSEPSKVAGAKSEPSKVADAKSEPSKVAVAASLVQQSKPNAVTTAASAQRPVHATDSRAGKVYTTVSKKDREAAEVLYASEADIPPSTLEEVAPAWVLQRPGPSTQGEKSNAARGGVYPCVAPDPGFGNYQKWVQVAPMAHVLMPSALKLNSGGLFDVVFHFHGREPIRKEWVQSADDAVLVAVDVGIDSGSYATAFSDPRTFGQVLRAVEAHVASRGHEGARIGHVALSSWSAGFGAIEQILDQPLGQRIVDAVILLDGLHSGYAGHSLDPERMAPFVRFANAAVQGERLLFVSHSSIRTTGYASTTETAQYLVWKVGGRPEATEPKTDPMGLERMSLFSKGAFHVRGFKGSGATDHCAHLGLMRDVLRVHLSPRWRDQRPAPMRRSEPELDAVALRPSAPRE